jgi:hypothetical protein
MQRWTLPLIDPKQDDHDVWALLDEGCNSTCHGEQWRTHAEKVLKHRGYAPMRLSSGKSSFSGIGKATCAGRWRFPIALTMEPSAAPVHGTLDSAELAGQDTPTLLSLPAQAKLGLIKDVRAGTITLRDYPGESLRIGRHIQTGLLLVCLTQYGKGSHKKLEEFKLSKPLKAVPGKEAAFLVGGNMAVIDSFEAEPPPPVSCKNVIFVTLGWNVPIYRTSPEGATKA